MLSSSKFASDPHISFVAIKNLQVGQHFILPNFSQESKHFAESYLKRKLYVTNQMINVWNNISKDQLHFFKRILSGPIGIEKSYIMLYLIARAYAEGWQILYITDAAELDVNTLEKAGKVICKYFLTLNRDILTGNELKMLVKNITFSFKKNFIIVAEIILGELLKQVERKTLLSSTSIEYYSKKILQSGCDKVLDHSFNGYPQFDFMLKIIFIQVLITGITANDINRRNQIEIYLDEIYGPTHSVRINPISCKFNVSKNSKYKPEFQIVYIQGSSSTAKHSIKATSNSK
ncbi:16523_t:CDS:2 [Funneliformis caledonium]|uniref:16523_t:CDS:1 n=1 Tax=Funneliformis caledonium TaxID=1117310 RepID=A0A9N8W5R9_9GLOM|nr:16523_t:CDS:2 [Funneliformis caledonium]